MTEPASPSSSPPPLCPPPGVFSAQEFLGEPGSHVSHELLHTTYTDRSHATFPEYSHFEREVEPVRVGHACGHHPSNLGAAAEAEAVLREAGCGSGACGCHAAAQQKA